MTDTTKIIGAIAPALSSALKGPFHELANTFIIEKLTDGSETEADENSLDEKVRKLLNKPENLSAIKDIDKQFSLEMKNCKIDIFSLEEDQKPKSNISPQMVISLAFLSFYFIIISAVFYVEISDEINNVKGENSLMGNLEILLGVITAGVGQILSYWFGGALGKAKSEK